MEAELGEIGGVEEDIGQGARSRLVDVPGRRSRSARTGRAGPLRTSDRHGPRHLQGRAETRLRPPRGRRGDHGVPIALHGGTGLSDDVFRKCIALGCAKVNICTLIKHAFIDGFVAYHAAHNTQYDPLKVIQAQFDKMKKGIAANIQLFDGEGKA